MVVCFIYNQNNLERREYSRYLKKYLERNGLAVTEKNYQYSGSLTLKVELRRLNAWVMPTFNRYIGNRITMCINGIDFVKVSVDTFKFDSVTIDND